MRHNPQLPPVSNGILRLTVTYSSFSQRYENVLDYLPSGPVTVNNALMIQFLANWRAALEAPLAAVLPPIASIVQYSVAEINLGLQPTYEFLVPGGGSAGTASVGQQAGPVAVVLTKYTGVKGQHGRGRMYFPCVPVGFVNAATGDPNTLTSAAIGFYTAIATLLLVPLSASTVTWQLAVSTRPVRPNFLTTRAAVVTNPGGLVLEPILGTQRRRREGQGQ